MRTEIEDGMGCAGLVPTKAESSAEDAFRREREAYERLQAENEQLRQRMRQAHAMLKGEAYNPIPSLMTVRAVLDLLR